MENKNQTSLSLLWYGKDGNILESLHFALFLFVFSFFVATAPTTAMTTGLDTMVSAATTVGDGYEQAIRRLDRNVVYMPEIVSGAQVAFGDSLETMQKTNAYVVASLWEDVTRPHSPLVRWE